MKNIEITNVTGAFQAIEKELIANNLLGNPYPVTYGISNDSTVEGMQSTVNLIKEVKNDDIDPSFKVPKGLNIKRSLSNSAVAEETYALKAKIYEYVFQEGIENGKPKLNSIPVIELPKLDSTEEMLKVFEEQIAFAEAAINTMMIMLMTDNQLTKINSLSTGLPLYRNIVNLSNGITPEQYQQLMQVEKSILENLNNSNVDYAILKTEQLLKNRIMMSSMKNIRKTLKNLVKQLSETTTNAVPVTVGTTTAEAVKIKPVNYNVTKLTGTETGEEVINTGVRGLY